MHDFRNYRRLQLELIANRLLVIGPNGVGKSNLLEAVELLGSLRSHRASNDGDLIFWNKDQAILRVIDSTDDCLELTLNRKGGRRASKNSKTLARQVDLLGSFRCVGFSALDLTLVRGEPALRRNWLDRLVQQLEPIYSDLTTRFGRLLRQRNKLWRNYKDTNNREFVQLLNAFDSQMALVSTRIHRRRKRALAYLQPLASQWQKRLSQDKEELELIYLPGSLLEGDEEELSWRLSIEKQLLNQRPDEEKSGFCKVGPHRDEIAFLLNKSAARKFSSAGQQRTLVLSLKLAELELIGEIIGEPPVLLLDDVLAELDQTRQLILLEAVGEKHQCLISATDLEAFEGGWGTNSQILKLSDQDNCFEFD